MPSFPEFISGKGILSSGKGILSSGKGILSSDQSYVLRNACVLRCWPRARMKRINPGRSWSNLLLKKRLCFKLLPPAPGWRAQILVLLGRNFLKKKRVCFKVMSPAPGIECKWSGNRVQMEWKSRGVGISSPYSHYDMSDILWDSPDLDWLRHRETLSLQSHMRSQRLHLRMIRHGLKQKLPQTLIDYVIGVFV